MRQRDGAAAETARLMVSYAANCFECECGRRCGSRDAVAVGAVPPEGLVPVLAYTMQTRL